MGKTMCKWGDGRVKDDLEKFKSLVLQPKYACKKCGRVAKDEENLCKPIDLE